MILDVLENGDRYLHLNKGFGKAFEFLRRVDLKDLPVERYPIDGEQVYAIVARGQGQEKGADLLEAHGKYIDIQLVLASTDEMGWKAKSSCKYPSGPYDQDSDAQLFMDDPETWISTSSGAFVIFFPEDAHLAMISTGEIEAPRGKPRGISIWKVAFIRFAH